MERSEEAVAKELVSETLEIGKLLDYRLGTISHHLAYLTDNYLNLIPQLLLQVSRQQEEHN